MKDKIEDILNKRGKVLGDYSIISATIQLSKSSVRGEENWSILLNTDKESIDMIIHKLSRLKHGNFNWLDSWYDIVGYSKLALDARGKFYTQPANALDYEVSTGAIIGYLSLMDEDSLISTLYLDDLMRCIKHTASTQPWAILIEHVEMIICDLEKRGYSRVEREG